MRERIHILLLSLCALVLLWVCIGGIVKPLRFEKHVAARETAVMSHLQEIMRAEERYQAVHGRYTAQLGDLVSSGFLTDSVCVIPYTKGELFSLTVDVEKDAAGQPIQTVDCSALYHQYLEGLDSRSVSALTAEAGEEGRFAGLSLSRSSLLKDSPEETTK